MYAILFRHVCLCGGDAMRCLSFHLLLHAMIFAHICMLRMLTILSSVILGPGSLAFASPLQYCHLSTNHAATTSPQRALNLTSCPIPQSHKEPQRNGAPKCASARLSTASLRSRIYPQQGPLRLSHFILWRLDAQEPGRTEFLTRSAIPAAWSGVGGSCLGVRSASGVRLISYVCGKRLILLGIGREWLWGWFACG